MSVKLIYTQDRDRVHPFDPEIPFIVRPALDEGELIGFNLYMGECRLGTFDRGADAVEEIQKIFANENEHYFVSGYSDYD